MRALFALASVEWIGVQILISILKRAGHAVALLPVGGFWTSGYFPPPKHPRFRRELRRIASFRPDVILCSTTTYSWGQLAPLLKRAKEAFPHIPVVVGGIHPTVLPEQVLSEPYVDMICVGEGEGAILDLMDALRPGESPPLARSDIPNIWSKDADGAIVRNPLRPLVRDLDALPFPDKALFQAHGLSGDRAYVMTTRGCPFNCAYCFNHAYRALYGVSGRHYVRHRSPDDVVAELVSLRRRQRIRSVYFIDDTFVADKPRTLALLEAYRREVRLPFYCLVRADLVDNEIAAALKRAGCAYVAMGVESGSPRLRREVLNRHVTNERLLEAARIIKRRRLKLITINMFCFPTETLDEMLETVSLNLRMSPHYVFTHIFYPYPGTRLCTMSSEMGLLSDERYEQVTRGVSGYNSPTVLDHPLAQEAYNLKVALPILNAFRGLRRYALTRWARRKHSPLLLEMLSIASIPLFSGWDRFYRLKERLIFLARNWLYAGGNRTRPR